MAPEVNSVRAREKKMPRRRDLELQEIVRDPENVSQEEGGGSTDDSTRPLKLRQRPPRGELFRTAPLGDKENAKSGEKKKPRTAPGEEKAETKDTDEAELTFKDVKNALSNAQSLLRTAFFAAPAYFLVILSQRPYPPPWITRIPLIKKQLQDLLTLEMVVALTVVTVFHFALLILEFVYTRSPRIKGAYAAIGPLTLRLFVSSWMVMYTLHVPFIHQRSWHWIMTVCFILVNVFVAFVVGSRSLKIKESIIEV